MVAPACASLSNEAMRIDICGMDGAIASLVLDGDEAGMNWVVGRRRWGLVRAYAPHSSPRGERFDPWATDQDFGLYFILKEL